MVQFKDSGARPPGANTVELLAKLGELRAENAALEERLRLQAAQIQAQTDRADFVDDCIAEMAAAIYA